MSRLTTLSTHILDVSAGKPAAGVRVTLGTRTLETDEQGRIADLSGGGINPGSYRLLVEVGAYFGTSPHLFNSIALELRLDEPRHYHVPLLIAPYSCTTYHGI